MQIIKDKQIIDDNWTFISDDEAFPESNDNVCVSFSRWKQDKEHLLSRNGKLGIRLQPTDPVAEISNDLDHFSLIELDFPTFTDGRGFSQAHLLRKRYHFQGEIRATGNYMPEQVFYLSRVGINAFQLTQEKQLNAALATMDDFSVSYQ